MKRENENGKPLMRQSHEQWLKNIEMQMDDLQQADANARYLQMCVHDLAVQSNLSTLRNRLLMQKSLLSSLAFEVANNLRLIVKASNVITIGDIVTGNKLRDRVLKAEQETLLLRTSVHQLLSKAS
ncbi:MAG: hypothetical protein KIS94_05485 [Chitinophagales bacterium]|nr:hypothetical protein [Chitinophagales bacterium]